MNKNLKYVFKLILSGILLFSVLAGYNRITEPKYTYANSNWPTTSTFQQFYRMKKNTADVLFFGSSFAVNAFDPQKIYEASGIRSYNLGSEQQSIFMSYWWLKEALRYQSPKAAVLETRYAFYKESNTPFNMNESFMRKSLDPMKWSGNKMDAVNAVCSEDHAQSRMSYYFTNLLYHSRWKELTKEEIMMDAVSAPLKGFSPLFATNTEPFEPVTVAGNEEMIPLDPKMDEYLVKMRDLCRENDIELILVTVPATDMHPGMHRSLQEFADQHAISYYDFAEKSMFEQCGWDLSVENPADHMNWHGAEHMSEIIAGILKEKGIEPVSDPQWEESRDYHEMIRTKGQLSAEQDLKAYLNIIKNSENVLLMSEDTGTDLPEEYENLLKEILNAESLPESWTGITYNGVSEISETGQEGNWDGKLEYSISKTDTGTEMILNGSDYSRKENGLHFTVYDPGINKVIDEVCFAADGNHVTALRD